MDIFIYGTGEQAQVVYESVLSMNSYNVVCFIEDLIEKEEFMGVPVLTTPEAVKLTKTGVVAIGANHIREKVVNEIVAINANINFVTVIHSRANVSPTAVVSPGSVIMPGAIVNAGAVVEPHCVINTGSILEHDCKMRSYSSLAPGVVVGGDTEVGSRSFISLGSKLKHGIKIGEDTVIGMGSVVTDSIEEKVVAYGSPCKVVKKRDPHEKYL